MCRRSSRCPTSSALALTMVLLSHRAAARARELGYHARYVPFPSSSDRMAAATASGGVDPDHRAETDRALELGEQVGRGRSCDVHRMMILRCAPPRVPRGCTGRRHPAVHLTRRADSSRTRPRSIRAARPSGRSGATRDGHVPTRTVRGRVPSADSVRVLRPRSGRSATIAACRPWSRVTRWATAPRSSCRRDSAPGWRRWRRCRAW